MDVPALRRLLIGLIGPDPLPAPDCLTAQGWAELDRIAAMHRLQPLLLARHGTDPALPAPIAASWRAAHRVSAMTALSLRAELLRCHGLLEAAGLTPIALKGAWLAPHAYPDPAQRPMRDLDLLVPGEQVLNAFEMLLKAGYEQLEPAELSLEAIVRLDKHMPALLSPGGVVVELHHRLWEPHGRLSHASPCTDEAALFARAIRDSDEIRYLAPQDLLAHLIIHALYSHRLDCGPLVLPDIANLLAVAPIDWAVFWRSAAAEGWRDGARLVLELVARSHPTAPIDFTPDAGPPPPPELLDAAPDLLLQELDTRASAQFAAATIKGGWQALRDRISGRRRAEGEAAAWRETAHEGGRIAWMLGRGWRTLRDLARADARRQSRQLAALSSWLDR
jgi:hypothetical protein